jgi:hypothetical protein
MWKENIVFHQFKQSMYVLYFKISVPKRIWNRESIGSVRRRELENFVETYSQEKVASCLGDTFNLPYWKAHSKSYNLHPCQIEKQYEGYKLQWKKYASVILTTPGIESVLKLHDTVTRSQIYPEVRLLSMTNMR